jgi:hypothetical protein
MVKFTAEISLNKTMKSIYGFKDGYSKQQMIIVPAVFPNDPGIGLAA